MSTSRTSSQPAPKAKGGDRLPLIAFAAAAGFVFVTAAIGISSHSPKAPKAVSATPAAPAAPAIDYSRTSHDGQLMTDYQVGKVLGDIKCGKRPVREAIDFLNVNGVPAVLLKNQTPEVVAGFQSATTWC